MNKPLSISQALSLNIVCKLLLLGCISVLVACASMSKEECLNANWKNIGYEDGSLGKPETTIQSHRKACAKINVTPDLSQYQLGHREGARSYCKKATGYQAGVSGGAYYNICPADLEPAFLKAYRLGQELFAVSQQRNQIAQAISGFESSIESLEQQKIEQEKSIVSAGSSSNERRAYLNEIRRIEDEIRSLERQIMDAEHQLDHLDQDYVDLQADHRRMGY
jgi:prefoldin subunit 5